MRIFTTPDFREHMGARLNGDIDAHAVRVATDEAGRNVDTIDAIVLRSYRRDEFGPTLDIHYANGKVAWLSYPGGFGHGGYYTEGIDPIPVLPGVTPPPADGRTFTQHLTTCTALMRAEADEADALRLLSHKPKLTPEQRAELASNADAYDRSAKSWAAEVRKLRRLAEAEQLVEVTVPVPA